MDFITRLQIKRATKALSKSKYLLRLQLVIKSLLSNKHELNANKKIVVLIKELNSILQKYKIVKKKAERKLKRLMYVTRQYKKKEEIRFKSKKLLTESRSPNLLQLKSEESSTESEVIIKEESEMDIKIQEKPLVNSEKLKDGNDDSSTEESMYYPLPNSVIKLNLTEAYFLYREEKSKLNQFHLKLLLKKRKNVSPFYPSDTNVKIRFKSHFRNISEFIILGIEQSKDLDAVISVYFLIICIASRVYLLPDIIDRPTPKNVEDLFEEMNLVHKCAIPDIIADFYGFVNLCNLKNQKNLINFEDYLDNLWNDTFRVYFANFFKFAKNIDEFDFDDKCDIISMQFD